MRNFNFYLNLKKILIIFLLLIILYIYNITFIKYHESLNLNTKIKIKEEKSKIVVCLFGVVPRSIKYTWKSINTNLIEPLKQNYDVDIYIFNLNVEDTKVDGILLDQNDIEIIPYDYKEEEIQSSYDKNIIEICNKINCKIYKYSPKTVRNVIRQMYSEYRVGEFLEKNIDKYKGAVICGPDYYIVNKLDLREFTNSINLSEKNIYTTHVGDWRGYTNGLYFGSIKNLILVLKRYQYLNEYLPTNNNYEQILKKSFINNNINRLKSSLIFFKIRANKEIRWAGSEHDKNKVKNRKEIELKLKRIKIN